MLPKPTTRSPGLREQDDGRHATRPHIPDEAANRGYFYTNANEHHAAETSIVVMASDISSVWVRGGSAAGSEGMFVRAFDGIAWSNWDQFTLTTV